MLGKEVVDIFSRDTVDEDVVDGLDVEGFLDFGVGSPRQVEQDDGRNEKREEGFWPGRQRAVQTEEQWDDRADPGLDSLWQLSAWLSAGETRATVGERRARSGRRVVVSSGAQARRIAVPER